MYPVIFQFGSVGIYTYGLFVALGLFTAIGVSKRMAVPYGVLPQTITDIFFVILVSAIIGARTLYVIINFSVFKNNFLEIFKIWNGGLVFFGGFIAAVVCVAFYLYVKKMDLWIMSDILAPGIALGHAVGRIGCLFAGCCYGKQCDLPIAIRFSHPETLAPIGVDLHPTQIYMVLSNLLLFFILLWVNSKKKFDGQIFLVYLVFYSLFRGLIEFWRGDFRGDFFFKFLSVSQGIGLLVAISALIILFARSRSVKK